MPILIYTLTDSSKHLFLRDCFLNQKQRIYCTKAVRKKAMYQLASRSTVLWEPGPGDMTNSRHRK